MLAGDAINNAAQNDLALLLLHHTVVKVFAGWHILPEVISMARVAGCHLVAPALDHILLIYGSTDLMKTHVTHLHPQLKCYQMKCGGYCDSEHHKVGTEALPGRHRPKTSQTPLAWC